MSNTLFVGKVYYCFDELPSTNDWAANLVAQGMMDSHSTTAAAGNSGPAKTRPPEGTVVRAANQTAGRGQVGSRWQSAPGENLLLSIIFYPVWLEAQAQFYLSMAMALGVRDLLTGLVHAPVQTSVKWPNDLYLGNKKTAGILIQNTLSGSNLQSSIVGIGLNVNQLVFPENLPDATSLALSFEQQFDLDHLAERLFECLERRYLQLKVGNRAAIKAEYEARLWRRGQVSRFVRSKDGLEFEGVIQEVTERGLLRVELDGIWEEFELKEIKVLYGV